MRKRMRNRILSVAMCAVMMSGLITPFTSTAAEATDATQAATEATTETTQVPTEAEVSTTEIQPTSEATTEVSAETQPVQAPSEEVVFDHFFETGIAGAYLKTKDFSACELLAAVTDPVVFTSNTTVVSEYEGVYLLRFNSPEETMYAYSYYYDKVDMLDINADAYKTATADTDVMTEGANDLSADLTDINTGDDALSEASNLQDVELKKDTIALIDTGCEGPNVKETVSVLGGDAKDDNGHGTLMYDAIVAENPEAEVLSIKAMDKDGKAQASDIYAAITYAVNNGASIINLSVSAPATQSSEIVESAIKDAVSKGIIVVGAAGNQGRKAVYYTPARVGEAYIIGAADESGKKLSISNYGPTVDYNVCATSTSLAAASFSGIVSRDGIGNIKVNEGKVFATDYEPIDTSDSNATATDAEMITETSDTSITEVSTTEAADSMTTEKEATDETSTTDDETTGSTTEVSTKTDTNGTKWDIKGLIENIFEVQDASYNNGGFNLNITSSDVSAIMATGKHYMTCIEPGGNQASGSNPPYGLLEGLYWMCGNANTNYNSPFHFNRTSIEALGWRFAIAVPGARHMYYVYYKGANPNTKTVPSYDFHNALGKLLENNTVTYDNHTFSPLTDAGTPSSDSYKVKNIETGNYVNFGANLKTKLDNGVLRTDRLQFITGTGYFGATVNVPSGFTFHYYINGGEYDAAGGTHVDVPDGTEGYFYTSNYTGKATVATNSAGWYIDSVFILVPQEKVYSASYGKYLSIQQMVAPTGKIASLNFEIESANGSLSLKKTCLNTTPNDYSYAGCTYEVYKVANEQAASGTLIGRFVCDAAGTGKVTYASVNNADVGTTTLTKLPLGSYMVKETAGNDYFALNSTPYYKTITANNAATTQIFSVSDYQNQSYVTLKKSMSNAECVKGSPLYSLIGTKYQIYTDAACSNKAQALVYDANGNFTRHTEAVLEVKDEAGNTNTLCFRSGVYYAKEIAAGKGYKISNQIHRIVLTDAHTEGNPYIVNAEDEPILDPVRIELNKVDSEGIPVDPSGEGGATLEGAVFKVAYYNDYYDKATYKNANPERVWYIQTKYDARAKKYKADFDADHLATGYISAAFYYNSVEQPNFPLGTVVITEEKPSNGYKIDGSSMTVAGKKCENEVFIGQVRQIGSGDEAEMYIDDGTGSYTTNAEGQTIKVNNKAADGSDLAVAEEIKRSDFSFVKVNYETGVEMPDIFFKVTSSNGETHYVKTGSKGMYSSEAASTSHTQYTNYYDRLFDDDKANDYVDVNGTKTYIGDLDCGLWFFGSADQTKWNEANIDDKKGALRYDEKYTLEEIVGKNNKGFQMIIPEEFSTNVKNGTVFLGVISNVPTPSIHTLEWDKDTKTHVSIVNEGEVNYIMDTVSYKYLTAGEKYTAKGIIMELNEDGTLKGPMLDKDGNYIRANKPFTVDSAFTKTKQEKCGSVDVEYSFTGTDLKGKSFVIFEYLFAGEDDTLIPVKEDGTVDETGVLEFAVDNDGDESIPDKIYVKHTDETDTDQIGLFPELKTKAFATETKQQMLLISDSMKISDTVTYAGLNKGIDYKVTTTLMYKDKRDGKVYPVKDKEGNDLAKVTPYTTTDTSGEFTVDLPEFDGTQLLDENKNMITSGVVVYEEISLNGVVYASHTSIEDKEQTVYIPSVGTTAKDKATDLQISKAGKVTIIDTVNYNNVIPGKEFTLYGELYNRRTGEVLKDADGKVISNTKVFTPTSAGGSEKMEFTFDASLLAGETIVAFETLRHNDIDIAVHTDINSDAQSIWIPKITTTLREGETGSKNVLYTDDVYLIDTVNYENLPDGEYIMRGELWNKDTNKPVSIDGKTVTGEKKFKVENGVLKGSVNVEYHFDATKTDLIKEDGSMSPTVCFEEVIAAVNIAEQGHTETVTIPAYDEEVTEIHYICNDCDKSFETVEEFDAHKDNCTASGYEVKSEVVDTIHHDESTKEVYVVDSEAIKKDAIVAEEKSIDNVDQTVTPPEMHTTATDQATGGHTGVVGETATIVDKVSYTGLLVGKEYTVKGTLYIQPESVIGTAISKDADGNIKEEPASSSDAQIQAEPLMIDGKPVTAETTFTADKTDGEVEVVFTFDSSALAGKSVTVFEDLYYNNIRVCTHSDITDREQTVDYPSCHTTATNKEDGTHIAKPNDKVTIVDRVYYENLVAGETYSTRGTLMDASTGEKIMINGQPVMAEAEFTAAEKSGYVDVEFTFTAKELAGKTAVVFEDIYKNGVIVCSHRDINSDEQTIVFTDQPQTGDILLWIFLGIGLVGTLGSIVLKIKK